MQRTIFFAPELPRALGTRWNFIQKQLESCFPGCFVVSTNDVSKRDVILYEEIFCLGISPQGSCLSICMDKLEHRFQAIHTVWINKTNFTIVGGGVSSYMKSLKLYRRDGRYLSISFV